jgi:hypothetical protein
MPFGYTGTVVALGLLAIPAAVKVEAGRLASPIPPKATSIQPVMKATAAPDPRAARLRAFFSRLHCPARAFADDFIRAADDNKLDWRLLPGISIVESGGGKAYRNNNIFGWNNGTQAFPSIRNGIREVAFRLGRSPIYRHRDTVQKLRVYNGDEHYAETVVAVMNRISPDVNLQTAREND